jgi:hypothetical protein
VERVARMSDSVGETGDSVCVQGRLRIGVTALAFQFRLVIFLYQAVSRQDEHDCFEFRYLRLRLHR